MAHRLLQAALAVVLAAAILSSLAGDACAQGYGAPGWASPEPNSYAMPAGGEGLTAALYPCPRPTPPLVGETYITYSPLAPQEFLYVHHRFFKTHNGDHQVTRTSVTYGHHMMLWPFQPEVTNGVPGLHSPMYGCKY
jgi:hypothetical protein